MAVNSLNARETISVTGAIADTVTGGNQPCSWGAGPLPVLTTTWVFGTGANAAAPAQIYSDAWYMAQRTVSATTYDNLALYGSLLNFEGAAINFANVKRFDIVIPSPTSTTPVQVGPQNQTHAWGGTGTPWPGGTGATIYDECLWWLRNTNPWGFTVTSSPASVLSIYNPNAGSITYTIWALGD